MLEEKIRIQPIKDRLAQEGYELALNTSEQMGRRLKTELDNWSKVVKAAGLTANN